MSVSNSRKRKCSYQDNEKINYFNNQDHNYFKNSNKINSSNIGNNKIIVVQKDNELLQNILDNQKNMLQQINNLYISQENHNKKLSNQIHQLQINISNYENIIPNIIKDKIKDCIDEIIFTIENNKMIDQVNNISIQNDKNNYYL